MVTVPLLKVRFGDSESSFTYILLILPVKWHLNYISCFLLIHLVKKLPNSNQHNYIVDLECIILKISFDIFYDVITKFILFIFYLCLPGIGIIILTYG